jgi:hypothetical protein
MITLQNIEGLCKLNLRNRAGVRRVRLTAVSNISPLGVIEEPIEVFDIAFRNTTGAYTEKKNGSRAGDYSVKECTFYIPRLRATVHQLCRTTMNRKLAAIITDKNGEEYLLYNAKLTFDKGTGDAPGSSNGTQITLRSHESHKAFFPYMTLLQLTGNEGTTPGTDFGGGQGPIDFPNDPDIEACCITIEPVAIPFLPAASGNMAYRNKVFTSSINGERYFIDKKGDAVQLSGGSNDYEIFQGAGLNEFEVQTFDLDATEEGQLIVFRNGVRLGYREDPGTSLDFYTVEDGKVVISSDWPLDAGETIYIYKLSVNTLAA